MSLSPVLEPIIVSGEACADFTRSARLEWLETNGAGAFAMGTVSGANTRRYHGLLVGGLRPLLNRHVWLAKVDEEVSFGGRVFALGANQYPGAVHPRGFQFLAEFRLDPFPIWTYQLDGARIEKKIFLVAGRQSVVVQYRCDRAVCLAVRPFLAFRQYHSLGRANSFFDSRITGTTQEFQIRPYGGLPPITFQHNGEEFRAGGGWYLNTEYLEELERGLDFREDLFCPGVIVFHLTPEAPAWIVASVEERETCHSPLAAELECAEQRRRLAQPADPLAARLFSAAEQFLVPGEGGRPSVVAGYPWFTAWGRDTMISLPGLLVARGRLAESRDIIATFLGCLNQGLIPNRFPDQDRPPEYNTADATLWMFSAVHSYLEAGGEEGFLRDVFYPAGKQIIRWHQRGTHFKIGVDPADGLLSAGEAGTQLTWMDAQVGDWVVTPRHGKPVEINALWYNALRLMEQWAKRLGDLSAAWTYFRSANRVRESFSASFWNPDRRCLYDVLTPAGPDPRLRPNQIFAVSLPFPLLPPDRQKAVVRAVEANLLTPVGLRTLAPGEEEYQPRYQGDVRQRDGAYHQGTVWPWLLGPFVTAYLNAFGRSKKNLSYCRTLCQGLKQELHRGCLGTVGELFDAEPPHRPGGAPAQAWSVAELLRVLVRVLPAPGSAEAKPKAISTAAELVPENV